MTSESLYNTWNYLQGTRYRLLCDIFEYSQEQVMPFLKKKFWPSVSEARPAFIPCLSSEKGQNSCDQSPILHIPVESQGRGNLLWALKGNKVVSSIHQVHFDIRVTGFRDKREPTEVIQLGLKASAVGKQAEAVQRMQYLGDNNSQRVISGAQENTLNRNAAQFTNLFPIICCWQSRLVTSRRKGGRTARQQ